MRLKPMPRTQTYPGIRLSKLTLILGIVFLVIAVITAVVAYNMVNNFVLGWSMTPIEGVQINQPTATAAVNAQGTPIPSTNNPVLPPVIGMGTQSWDGTSRVTILLIGLDYRDWEAGGPPRSDTMMLLTLDPLSKTAGMLSIPRDMWVNIPWINKYAKINEAYRNGELLKYPNGGGPGLAMETVHNFLGVPINYYAQIDFYAFEKFIDHLGGITVTIDTELNVDPLGRNPDGTSNTVHMNPGPNHLDGAATLGFARMRYTSGGDFDRANRQQQVVFAIRDRIVTRDMLPTLIQKSGDIYRDLSGGIRTNLSLDHVIKLALLAQQVTRENIRKGVLGPNEADFAKSPEGMDILVPKPDKVRIVRDQVFTTGGPASPATVDKDPTVLVKKEGAQVAFRNGTSTPGIATQTTDYFKKNGVNVIETTNADKIYNDSMIYIYTGKPYTAAYLASVFNIPTTRIINQYQPDSKADIVVVIGQDWVRKNPMSNK